MKRIFFLTTVLMGLLARDAVGADWKAFFRPSTPPATPQVQTSERSSTWDTQKTEDSEGGPGLLTDIFGPSSAPLTPSEVGNKVWAAIVLCPTQYLYIVKQSKGVDSVLAANSLYKSDSDLMKTCNVIYDPSKASKLAAARNFACRYAQCHEGDEDWAVSATAAKINKYLKCQVESVPEEKCPSISNFFTIATNDFPGFGSFAITDTALTDLIVKEGLSLGQEADFAKGIYIIGGLVKPFVP